jgi:tetratricopeptide (TPR) repeat protein
MRTPASSGGDALRADVDALVERGLVERGADASQFRFSHALVRDAVYSLLPFGFRRDMHALLGAWYERHHGDDPLMLARIAAHWDEAQDPVRAVRALEQAGNHALRTGAYREAQTLFGRLVDITTRGFDPRTPQPVEASAEQKARWQMHLGLASYDLGELERAREALESAAALLGNRVPGDAAIGPALALEAAQIVLHHFGLRRRASSDAGAARARQTAAVLSTLGRIYHLTQRPRHTLYSITRRFNLLEPHPPSPEQMGACSGMMYLTTMMGRSRTADAYAARVIELHRRLQNPLAYADANLTLALAWLGQARWDACERSATEAEQIFHRLGERQPRMTMVSMRANAAELQGHFARARQLWNLQQQLAEEAGDQLGQCWAEGGMAMLEIRHGDLAAAADHAARAQALAQATGEAVSYLADSGLLGLARFEQGDLAGARSLLDEGLSIIATLPRLATAHHLLNGLDTFSELALRFWAHEAPARGSKAWTLWSQQAALVVSRTSGYARRFAIGVPMATQRLALSHWLHGRESRALHTWGQAVTAGEQAGIPYETAKAHLALAQHLGSTDPQQRMHALRAGAIFERLGAQHGLAQAQALSGA